MARTQMGRMYPEDYKAALKETKKSKGRLTIADIVSEWREAHRHLLKLADASIKN